MPAEQLMRTTESIILSPTQISMILLKLHLVILLLWSGVCESDDHGWQNTQYKPVVRLLAISYVRRSSLVHILTILLFHADTAALQDCKIPANIITCQHIICKISGN